MRLDVLLLPSELPARPRPEGCAVVVDVIRASTSIVTAFQNGCRSLLPAESREEARRLHAAHPGALLAGERGGQRVPGFDLGNSPREFRAEAVGGRDVILTTSNGTRTLRAAAKGRIVAIGAFLNRRAVADWVVAGGQDALILCSGYEGILSLEDAVCAGGIADRAAQAGAALGDGALACQVLWKRYGTDLPGLLPATGWGRKIVELGLGEDLGVCAELDVTDIVPVLKDGRITVEAPRGRGAEGKIR